jgi:hypothetical protein
MMCLWDGREQASDGLGQREGYVRSPAFTASGMVGCCAAWTCDQPVSGVQARGPLYINTVGYHSTLECNVMRGFCPARIPMWC